MKVIIIVCVLTVGCGSYEQEVKSVVSEEIIKDVPEDIKIGDRSFQGQEQFREDLELRKMNNNDTLTVKLDNDFIVQGTKMGIIVVPDFPQEDIDLQYQPQNIYEIEENVTTAGLTIVNEDNMFKDDEIFNTAATLEEETESNTVVTLEPHKEENYDESLYRKLKDVLETTIELPKTDKYERNPSKHYNKTVDEVSHVTVARKNCTSKNTFPRLDFKMEKQVYTRDQDNKIIRMSEHEPSLKKLERRTFTSWNFLDIGDKKHKSVIQITKEVPYPVPYPVEKSVQFPVKVLVDRPIPIEVPKSYPVSFKKNIVFPIREYIPTPYPVYRKLPYFIQLSVDKPTPLDIPRPFPVYIEQKVPYPTEKQIKIPMVDRPIPVHIPYVRNVYYPIERKVRYPVPISEEKPVAVPVEKPYPVCNEKKIPTLVEEHFPYPKQVEDYNTKDGNSQRYNFQKDVEVESFSEHKTKHTGNHEMSAFELNDGGLAHLSLLTNVYGHTSFQKKENYEPEESKREEILQESITTQLPLKKQHHEERNTTKPDHTFGKKLTQVL